MANSTYKLVATINSLQEKDLPAIIRVIQRAGRLLHTDAMFILGDNPPPKIFIYGEDIVHEPDIKL